MDDQNSSQEQIKLDSFPDKVIAKIFAYCSIEDKRSLSLANKQLLNIYHKRPGVQFIFHMKHGFGDDDDKPIKPFGESFKALLNLKHTPIVGVLINGYMIDNYLLKDCFSDDGKELFGKPVDYYLRESYACKNIRFQLLFSVVIGDPGIEMLLKLFPDETNLFLYRCYKEEGNIELTRARILYSSRQGHRGWSVKSYYNSDKSGGKQKKIENDLVARLINDLSNHPGPCFGDETHSICGFPGWNSDENSDFDEL